MTTNNFMAADVRAILLSCCLFSVIGFGPGYAFGRLFNLMQFRRRTLACQAALSVAFSIALGPILTYYVGRFVSLDAAFFVFAGLSAYAAVALGMDLSKGRVRFFAGMRQYAKVIGLACLWISIAVLSLADLQIGRRLYFSIIGFDYCVRASFTSAVSNFGIPPPNPFYFPGHPVPLRYHYFWLAQAALINHVARPLVDARQAFVGATIWCGLGVICTLALYLRFFSASGASILARRVFIGVCLLGVTGLDIIPALCVVRLKQLGLVGTIFPSVEWWNNQVDGWLYTMLWEPHYLAAFVACLTAFLILWTISPHAAPRECLVACLAAGLALATGVGAGLYIAMVFAVFLLCWMIITLFKRWYRETISVAVAGIVAAVLATPFLLGLQEPASGGALLQGTVRSFFIGEYLLQALGLHSWQIVLGNALFLPLNYFLEFGFFLAAAKIQWDRFRAQKRGLTRYELGTLTMICASAGVCTFVKSGVIENNDLGWRGFIIAQFALLIVGTDLWASRSQTIPVPGSEALTTIVTPAQRRLLTVLLILGAAGVIYDLVILRMYPILSDSGVVSKLNWVAKDDNLGARTYANREAYEWLRRNSSARAIIQQDPSAAMQDTFYGLYANRQTVAEAADCGTVFGGTQRGCKPMVQLLDGLYSRNGSSDPDTFANVCNTLSIEFLIAKDFDPAWANQNSWIWRRIPVFANAYVRVFTCPRAEGNLVLTYRGKNRD